MKRHSLLMIVLLAVAVRVPGVFCGKLFAPPAVETDEGHHCEFGFEYFEEEHPEYANYFRATGIQMVGAARLARMAGPVLMGPEYRTGKPGYWEAIVAGRLLSTGYAALTVIVIYFMAGRWLGKERAAFAALLLSLSNLHVTQSHLALADVPGTFWLYLALFLLLLSLERKRLPLLASASLATGMAFGTKYLAMPLAVAVVLAARGRLRIVSILTVLVAFVVGFFLVSGFEVSRGLFARVAQNLVEDNLNQGLEKSRAWNLPILMVELLVGMGLPAFILLVIAAFRVARRPQVLRLPANLAVIVPLVIYTVVILSYEVPFARHLVPLIPACCMVAATVLTGPGPMNRARMTGNRWRGALRVFCVAYSLLAVVSAERPFIMDTRYQLLGWLEREVPAGTRVAADGYIVLPPKRYAPDELGSRKAQVVILHEAESFRYVRSPASPFRPPSPGSVYHKKTRPVRFMQGLFGIGPESSGTGYRLAARFRLGALVPEAILRERFWGSFNVLAGHVHVFRKESEVR